MLTRVVTTIRDHGAGGVAERLARRGVLAAHERDDVPRARLIKGTAKHSRNRVALAPQFMSPVAKYCMTALRLPL